MDSILTSIKKLLGIAEDYKQFDDDLIIHINSVFAVLTQLGVGSDAGFTIAGSSEKWDSFLNSDKTLELVKSYVYLKVRLLFDPPLSSASLESIKRLTDELEWRITVAVDETNEREKSA